MRILLLPPFALLLIAGAMLALHGWAPVATLWPGPLRWLGLAGVVAGLALAQWHARLFRRLGTNINTFGQPGTLVTGGLFGRTRNPMYLGMLLTLVGAAAVLGTLSPWAGPLAFFGLAQAWYIPLEERAMALKFGADYARYRQQVPRWW